MTIAISFPGGVAVDAFDDLFHSIDACMVARNGVEG
jgi:hypothetical protein